MLLLSIVPSVFLYFVDDEIIPGFLTGPLKDATDGSGARIVYIAILGWSCIMTLWYGVVFGNFIVARSKGWGAQRQAGPTKSRLLVEIVWDTAMWVVPLVASVALCYCCPWTLERLMHRLTGHALVPAVWQVFVFLVAVFFAVRLAGKVCRIWLATVLYEARFGRRIRKRLGQLRRFADERKMRYEERVAVYYPFEWVTVPGRRPRPQGRGDWMACEKRAETHPVYDLWSTAWQTGHGGYARNILTVNLQGRRLYLYDFHEAMDGYVFWEDTRLAFIAERGQRDHTIATLELPCHLPSLLICPEDLGDRVERVFGGIDIDMESIQISETYRTWSRDRRFAYTVFNSRMMELLSGHEGVAMRITRNLLSLRFPRLVPVEDLPECIDLIKRAFELIPSFVFDEAKPWRRERMEGET